MLEINLVDDSQYCITLTVWGRLALRVQMRHHTVIMLKAARVREFYDDKIHLSYSADCVFKFNPKLDETIKLKEWSKMNYKKDFVSLSD